MDLLAVIVTFVLGVIAFNIGNDCRSIALTAFGILLEISAISYIVHKFLKGG